MAPSISTKDTAGLQGVPEGQLRIRLILFRLMDVCPYTRAFLVFQEVLPSQGIKIPHQKIRTKAQGLAGSQARVHGDHKIIGAPQKEPSSKGQVQGAAGDHKTALHLLHRSWYREKISRNSRVLAAASFF